MKDRLKEIRKILKMKQDDFAKQIGVSTKSMSAYENGLAINSDTLYKIATIFGISLDWLITGEGSMFKGGAGKVHNVFGGNNIFSEINHGNIRVENQAKDEFELLCDEVREADEKKRLKIFHMVKLELLS